MTAKELPARPNLEQYRKQAKDLLKKYQLSDPDALSRIWQYHPEFKKAGSLIPSISFQLSDAQWVIAREYGFESWPKFAARVRHLAAVAATTSPREMPIFAIDLDVQTDELSCALTRDGRRAITAAPGQPVRVWEVETGRIVKVFDARSVTAAGIGWSPDEHSCFFGTEDGAVHLCDVERDRCSHIFDGHRGFVRCVALSSDGRRALSASGSRRDPAIRLWDVESKNCVRVMEGHADGVYDVAFDSRAERALSGSRDGTIRLWDLETGSCVRVFKGHTYHVHNVLWSADQRRILSTSSDIRLWDVESGRCLRVFEQDHPDTIRKLLWSADQRRALSAGHDGTVRLWDVREGRCLRVLTGHPVGVVTVAWSPDELRAYSCDWNGGIRAWDLT
jgi:WD40 repeat protein